MTLMLVAICAVASTPVLLKHFEKKEFITHGIWECRSSGGSHTVTKREKDGTLISGPTPVGASCTFTPPTGARDFHVDLCGGNPDTNCNYEDGTHVYMFYPTLNEIKNITVGSGGKVSFGDYAFAFYKDAAARVLIVY